MTRWLPCMSIVLLLAASAEGAPITLVYGGPDPWAEGGGDPYRLTLYFPDPYSTDLDSDPQSGHFVLPDAVATFTTTLFTLSLTGLEVWIFDEVDIPDLCCDLLEVSAGDGIASIGLVGMSAGATTTTDALNLPTSRFQTTLWTSLHFSTIWATNGTLSGGGDPDQTRMRVYVTEPSTWLLFSLAMGACLAHRRRIIHVHFDTRQNRQCGMDRPT